MPTLFCDMYHIVYICISIIFDIRILTIGKTYMSPLRKRADRKLSQTIKQLDIYLAAI